MISRLNSRSSLSKLTTRRTKVTVENINASLRNMEYAVRGALVLRAEQLDAALKAKKSLPFDEIIYCNIGNPQQLKQKPLTFVRQVLSVVEYPAILDIKGVKEALPADVVERAELICRETAPSVGAYTNSKGLPFVRRDVADFIEKRDGYPANPDHIFLSDGASPAVKAALKMLIRSPKDGIMIPIPQYPLYSAGVTLIGGTQVNYFLDESNGWSLSVDELERAYKVASDAGVTVRGLAVINPGNPTGQVLSVDVMQGIVKWAAERGVVLMADEVYQTNIYTDNKPFVSFKKVVCDLKSPVELLSFHSVSKGVIGECGKRGGYMEAYNFDSSIIDMLYKMNSVSLCPNVPGQLTVDLMVNPPKEGDASYESHTAEVDTLFQSLKRRASLVADTLNKLDGVTCNEVEGAMYAFPQIRLPPKAVQAAEKEGQKPDAFYAMQLLESTGICVVPGSGFGQREGTFHFRTTLLPPESKVEKVAKLMSEFHNSFMAKYKQ